MIRAWCCSLFLLFGIFTFRAQEQQGKIIECSVNYGRGAIIPEYQFVRALAKEPLTQIELNFSRQTNGSVYWQKLYKYPKFGVAVLFTTLGNKEVFGNEFALYPYFTLNSIRTSRFLWEHYFGLGLGYVSRKFSLTDNFENVAVGSHLNMHFMAKTNLQFSFHECWKLNTSIAFHHFSNANMREPNLGLNTLGISGGVVYTPKTQTEFLNPEIPVFVPKNEFAFVYAAGGKHTRALQSKVYFTSSFSAEYKRKWKHRFQYGLGLDLFYDSSTETEMNVPGAATYKTQYDFRSGIHFSQEFIYNKFSFILQEGVYLLLTDQVKQNPMYNRAILRYKWSGHFFTHISMKSHLHILDYPEIGFAYYF